MTENFEIILALHQDSLNYRKYHWKQDWAAEANISSVLILNKMTCGSVNSSREFNLFEGIGVACGGPGEDTVSAVLRCLRKIKLSPKRLPSLSRHSMLLQLRNYIICGHPAGGVWGQCNTDQANENTWLMRKITGLKSRADKNTSAVMT